MTGLPVRVVVVAFGAADLLDRTLSELGGSLEVLVVDNSSSPDVADVASRRAASYIDPGSNGGFAAGVNIGLEAAFRGDERHVLLLNPDAVVTPEQVALLAAAFHGPGGTDVAAVSPSLRAVDGTPQRVMWPFPHPARACLEALGLGRFNRAEQFAVGTALLLRRDAVVDVGLFDARFFLYAEETDWQRRAALRGWRSVNLKDLLVEHVGGGTSSDPVRRERLFHAGTETYVRKWFGTLGWQTFRGAQWAGAAARSIFLPGPRRHAARLRADIYRRGPRRAAGLGGG